MPCGGHLEAKHGVFTDTKSTYCPNLRHDTFILLFAISVLYDLDLASVDVTACFLNVPLPPHRKVFVTFPTFLTGGLKKYFQMLVACYGLMDAARLWYECLIPKLFELGFIRSKFDPCLFVWLKQNNLLIIGLTTDDLLLLFSKTKIGHDMVDQ